MWNAVDLYNYAQSFRDAYSIMMKPLCDELGMAQNAVDILMFIANNPDKNTSAEIKKYIHIGQGLISFYADKLEMNGYLRRETGADRRKCYLFPTEKAMPIIEKGREFQQNFQSRMLSGLTKEQMDSFFDVILAIKGNLEQMAEGQSNE